MKKLFFVSFLLLLCISAFPFSTLNEEPVFSKNSVLSFLKDVFGYTDSKRVTLNIQKAYDSDANVWNIYSDFYSFSAEIDADTGILRRYYFNGTSRRFLPVLTRKQAYEKAVAFLKMIGVYNQQKFNMEYTIPGNSSSSKNQVYLYYDFTFPRIIDSIKFLPDFSQDGITISIDPSNGQIQSFNYNWSDFDDTIIFTKKITPVQAEKELRKNIMVLPTVKSFWNDDEGATKYILCYDFPTFNSNVPKIDSITGMLTDEYGDEINLLYNASSAVYSVKQEYHFESTVLQTPMSMEDALYFTKNFFNSTLDTFMNLNFEVNYSGLPDERIWNLSIYDQQSSHPANANISIDAIYGKVKNLYYSSFPSNEESTLKTPNQALERAKEILESLSVQNDFMAFYISSDDKSYLIDFKRILKNGIIFSPDAFIIRLDKYNLQCLYMNLSYTSKFDIEKDETLISQEEAFSILTAERNFDLYLTKSPSYNYWGEYVQPKTFAVYTIVPYSEIYLKTDGKLINPNGYVIKDTTWSSYNKLPENISHTAQILYDNNLIDYEFIKNLDKAVTVHDALKVLSAVTSAKNMKLTGINSEYNIFNDTLYVKEINMSHDTVLTKELLSGIIGNFLNLKPYVHCPEIFGTIFNDQKEISQEYLPYCMLLYASKIIPVMQNTYMPKQPITGQELITAIFMALEIM